MVSRLLMWGVPSDSDWDFVEPQSFSLSKKRNFACVENPGRYELPRNAGSCKDGAVRDNSEWIKLEIADVEDYSLGLEH